MTERADRGELRTTRERFGEHFDRWLRDHHSIDKGTRGDYRRHGERRLKPFFGAMRLPGDHCADGQGLRLGDGGAGRGR